MSYINLNSLNWRPKTFIGKFLFIFFGLIAVALIIAILPILILIGVIKLLISKPRKRINKKQIEESKEGYKTVEVEYK